MARLPRPPDRFVGRDAALDQLSAALGHAGVVTLVGPGGVGKTRLAIEAAWQWSRARGLADGAALCELATSTSVPQVCDATFAGLRVPDGWWPDGPSPAARLGRHLAERGPPLVILDNAEGCLAVLAELLRGWQADAPDVRFLVTSREPLGVDGEHVLDLPPLDPASAATLFQSRAPADRAPGPRDAAAVARVCKVLEGMPLAVELGAARLDVLSLAELELRLADPLPVLRNPLARSDDRHATVWRTVAWSWALLAPWEQAALLQLAVFRGGVTLDAAEAIVQIPPPADLLDPGPSVLDALHALVRRSLLRRTGTGAGDRFTPYELVREFAEAVPDPAGLRATARDRHRAWFAARAGDWAGQPAATRADRLRLFAERDNLAAALSQAEAVQAWDDRARLHLGLGPVVEAQRGVQAALAMLHDGLDLAADTPLDPGLHGRMLSHVARHLAALGRVDEAQATLEQAIHHAGLAGDDRTRGHSLGFWGDLLRLQGQPHAALERLQQALDLAEAIGARDHTVMALGVLALVQRTLGDAQSETTRARLAASLADHTDALPPGIRAATERCLGNLAFDAQEYDTAQVCYQRAEAISAPLGMLREAGFAAHNSGMVAVVRRDFDAAAAAFGRARETAAALGHRGLGGIASTSLALVHLERDDLDAAARHLGLALHALGPTEDRWHKGSAWSFLAAVEHLRGSTSAAEQAMEAARGELEGSPDPSYNASLHAGSIGLAVAAAQRACTDGDRAAALALLDQAREHLAGLDIDTRYLQFVFHRDLSRRVAELDALTRAWRVAADGSWFEPPGGDKVSLGRRRAPQHILSALAAGHAAHDTPAIPDLIAAGWPGERILPDAARNRLYVAINTLRKLGLEPIERAEGGYRLDPAVPVIVV